jgi:hypothetical protein
MKCRLFTILSALSLLLFVVVVALWVRSYWVGDLFQHVGDEGSGQSARGVFTASGSLGWWRDKTECQSSDPEGDWARMMKQGGIEIEDGWQWLRLAPPYVPGEDHMLQDQWDILGFRWAKADLHYPANPSFTWGVSFGRFVAPFWCVALVAGVLPLTAMWRWWTKRPNRAGLCLQCGYDLRATPGRCPECGAETRVV